MASLDSLAGFGFRDMVNEVEFFVAKTVAENPNHHLRSVLAATPASDDVTAYNAHHWFSGNLAKVHAWLESILPPTLIASNKQVSTVSKSVGESSDPADTIPIGDYFGFIPPLLGEVPVGGPAMTWSTPCFEEASVSVAWAGNGIDMKFKFTNPKKSGCSD